MKLSVFIDRVKQYERLTSNKALKKLEIRHKGTVNRVGVVEDDLITKWFHEDVDIIVTEISPYKVCGNCKSANVFSNNLQIVCPTCGVTGPVESEETVGDKWNKLFPHLPFGEVVHVIS